MKRPDFAVPVGFLIGIVGISIAAVLEGVRLSFLWQPTAALIVLGGTIGAILIRRGFQGLLLVVQEVVRLFMTVPRDDQDVTRNRLAALARLARREGVQTFEAQAAATNDPLIAQALIMGAQYAEPAAIRNRLNRILDYEDERGLREVGTLEGADSYAPTFGILGAILGLIQVLRSLADPATLGVGIATAFVATIYGVGLANLFLFPLAARLRERHSNRMRKREALAEALIALTSHQSPTAIARMFVNEVELATHRVISR